MKIRQELDDDNDIIHIMNTRPQHGGFSWYFSVSLRNMLSWRMDAGLSVTCERDTLTVACFSSENKNARLCVPTSNVIKMWQKMKANAHKTHDSTSLK